MWGSSCFAKGSGTLPSSSCPAQNVDKTLVVQQLLGNQGWKNIGKGVGGGNPGEPRALPALRSPVGGHSLKGGKQAPVCSKDCLPTGSPWCNSGLVRSTSCGYGLPGREGGGKRPHGVPHGHSEHLEDPISGQLAPGLNISKGRTQGTHAGGREQTAEGSVYQHPRGVTHSALHCLSPTWTWSSVRVCGQSTLLSFPLPPPQKHHSLLPNTPVVLGPNGPPFTCPCALPTECGTVCSKGKQKYPLSL